MQEQTFTLSAANSPAAERAAFIRKTYTHLAGALLLFTGLEYYLVHAPFAQKMAMAMTSGFLMADRVGRLHGGRVRIGQDGQIAVFRGHAVPRPRLVRGGGGNNLSTLALYSDYVFRRGADSHRGIDDLAAGGRLDRHGVHNEEGFFLS